MFDAAEQSQTISVPPPKTPKTVNSTAQQTIQSEPAQHPTKRQTTIITEYFDSPAPPVQASVTASFVNPHEIPLPRSRAPTLTLPPSSAPLVTIQAPAPGNAKNSSPHEIPPRHPSSIPLPPSQPAAPTIYEGSPELFSPKTDRTARSHNRRRHDPGPMMNMPPKQIPAHILRNMVMPSVSVIDYAVAAPLPESRGTTTIGSPKAAMRLVVS